MTARNDSFAHDKLEIHHRRQLSALMDGDLAVDEARFLLRRLRHDRELAGCWERWQLCGDVLRGQAQAPAPAGFAERVALAVAAERPLAGAAEPAANTAHRPRHVLARWGGGALAASVALVALFMARQQSPQEAPAPAGPQVASQQQSPSTPAPIAPQAPSDPAPDAEAYAAAAVAVASVPRRQDNAARRSATRTQQAARSAARVARAEQPQRVNAPPVGVESVPALAAATPLHPQANPFASRPQDAMAPQARPWPRSTLSGYPAATGSLTTGYATDSAARAFYPFEPRLPSTPPVAPETVPQE